MKNPYTDKMEMGLMELPEEVVKLLKEMQSPFRLVAHLRLVHDVAVKLVYKVENKWPLLVLDKDAIFFGAATHDIGKVFYKEELHQEGNKHEEKGYEFLLNLGFPHKMARFTLTHAYWKENQVTDLEDLIVSLADTCWKSKRIDFIVDSLCQNIASSLNCSSWEVFLFLDCVVDSISDISDIRLAWQCSY